MNNIAIRIFIFFFIINGIPKAHSVNISPSINPSNSIYDWLLLSNQYRYSNKHDIFNLSQLKQHHIEAMPDWISDYLQQRNYQQHQSYAFTEIDFGFLVTNALRSPIYQIRSLHQTFQNFDVLDQGLTNYKQNHFYISPRFSAVYNGAINFNIKPFIYIDEENLPHNEFEELNIKLGLHHLEITAGRFNFFNGYGHSGSSLFGGIQKPVTGIQIRNTEAIYINPFFGNALVNFTAMRMDKDNTFPNAAHLFSKINFSPKPWFQWGFAQSIIFAGKDSPDVPIHETALDILGFRLRNFQSQDFTNLSNRSVQIDFFTSPKSLEHQYNFYGELTLEDCCSLTIDTFSTILLGTNYNFPSSMLGLEFIRNTQIVGRNGAYATGLADRNTPIGHRIGPDALGYYLFYKQQNSKKNQLNTMMLAYEKRAYRGITLGGSPLPADFYEVPEHKFIFSAKKSLRLNPLNIDLQSGYAWIKNSLFQANQNRHDFLFSIQCSKVF